MPAPEKFYGARSRLDALLAFIEDPDRDIAPLGKPELDAYLQEEQIPLAEPLRELRRRLTRPGATSPALTLREKLSPWREQANSHPDGALAELLRGVERLGDCHPAAALSYLDQLESASESDILMLLARLEILAAVE